MLVNYNAKNLFYYRNFRFVPQANIVPDDLWKEMKSNPVIQKKIKAGVFVEDSSVECDSDSIIDSLESVSLKDAKELIKNCLDIVQLEKWLANDNRKGVASAIDEQIEKLISHMKVSDGNNT